MITDIHIAITYLYHDFFLIRDAVRYSFGSLLKAELNCFMTEWNRHRICPSKMAEIPSGIPNVLFHFPELQGFTMVYLMCLKYEMIFYMIS